MKRSEEEIMMATENGRNGEGADTPIYSEEDARK